MLHHVIPAKAGIQRFANISYVYIEDLYDGLMGQLDSSLRWNDIVYSVWAGMMSINFAKNLNVRYNQEKNLLIKMSNGG